MAQSLHGEEEPPHTTEITDHSEAQSNYDRRREQVRRAQKYVITLQVHPNIANRLQKTSRKKGSPLSSARR